MFKCLFDQDGQSVDALAEVNNVTAQMNSRQIIRRPHHTADAAALSTVLNTLASTEPTNPTLEWQNSAKFLC